MYLSQNQSEKWARFDPKKHLDISVDILWKNFCFLNSRQNLSWSFVFFGDGLSFVIVNIGASENLCSWGSISSVYYSLAKMPQNIAGYVLVMIAFFLPFCPAVCTVISAQPFYDSSGWPATLEEYNKHLYRFNCFCFSVLCNFLLTQTVLMISWSFFSAAASLKNIEILEFAKLPSLQKVLKLETFLGSLFAAAKLVIAPATL